jgi:hypothetical protein
VLEDRAFAEKRFSTRGAAAAVLAKPVEARKNFVNLPLEPVKYLQATASNHPPERSFFISAVRLGKGFEIKIVDKNPPLTSRDESSTGR